MKLTLNCIQVAIGCRHEYKTCRDCVQTWIESTMTRLNYESMVCFAEGCNEVLCESDVKVGSTPETYDR